MKAFSAMLSIYMFALLFVPCADVHAENHSTEINSVTDTHSHDIDTCSPFCFCECCQTVSQTSKNINFSCFTILIKTFTPQFHNSTYSIPVTLWRPPKA